MLHNCLGQKHHRSSCVCIIFHWRLECRFSSSETLWHSECWTSSSQLWCFYHINLFMKRLHCFPPCSRVRRRPGRCSGHHLTPPTWTGSFTPIMDFHHEALHRPHRWPKDFLPRLCCFLTRTLLFVPSSSVVLSASCLSLACSRVDASASSDSVETWGEWEGSSFTAHSRWILCTCVASFLYFSIELRLKWKWWIIQV